MVDLQRDGYDRAWFRKGMQSMHLQECTPQDVARTSAFMHACAVRSHRVHLQPGAARTELLYQICARHLRLRAAQLTPV